MRIDRGSIRRMLCLVSLAAVLSPALEAGDFNCTATPEGTVCLVRYAGAGGDVVIPATIDGKPVTSIGNRAFLRATSVTRVTIPESVTVIENGKLSLVGNDKAWPSWGAAVPQGTFAGCTNLTGVSISMKLTDIGSYAFAGCSRIESVDVPHSVTRIGAGAFANCRALRHIGLPSGLEQIERQTFENCSRLSALDLPESLTAIDDWAFQGCSALEHLRLPDRLNTVGHGAFRLCEGMRRVAFGGGLTKLGRYVFSGCTALEEVRFSGPEPEYGEDLFFRVPNVRVYPDRYATGAESVNIVKEK